jgi:ribosomal protein S18 acetylase RimI-like enzyme
MPSSAIAISPTTEREQAIAVISEAFRNDPVTRWVWPADDAYETGLPRMTEAMSGRAFEHGTAYATSDFGGVALWLPPGVQSDGDAMGEVMEETVEPELMDDLRGFTEGMAAFHLHGPHWYLPFIAVGPEHQGKGYGSQLMSHGVALADADGLPAYLEATTLDSRRLYEHHGFEVMGEIQFGSSPQLWPMRREPP